VKRVTKDFAIQLLSNQQCKRGLSCVGKEHEEICKVMDIGKGSYMICLEKEAYCSFAVTPFRPVTDENDENLWCTCPVRMYIAREYSK
jgi:hypothetical protein